MRTLPLLLLLAAGCGPGLPPVATKKQEVAANDENLSAEPLLIGDKVPAYTAAGWVHGPPPAYDAPGVKLTVLDFWSLWCPRCKDAAPVLVQLHTKYKDRGVQFVSVSSMPKEGAIEFGETNGFTWPQGYVMPVEDVAAVGCFRPGQTAAGFAMAPTVYVVGRDGRVRWSDKRSRMRQTTVQQLQADLDAALAAELAK